MINENGEIIYASNQTNDNHQEPRRTFKNIFQLEKNISLTDWQSFVNNNNLIFPQTKNVKLFRSGKKNFAIYFVGQTIGHSEKPKVKKTFENRSFQFIETNCFLFKDDGTLVNQNDDNAATSKVENINECFLETDFGKISEVANNSNQNFTLLKVVFRGINLQSGLALICRKNATNQFLLFFFPLEEFNFLGNVSAPHLDNTTTNDITTQHFEQDFSFEKIITKNAAYKQVLGLVAQVADTDTTVLITGETGTGKELLSDALHALSDRSDHPFIKVNCATIPAELAESILFGHEKGSFTGAHDQQIGKFELAHNGTILLDEIGELPLNLQPKLLRVLQEDEIERIGSPKTIKINTRVIAATNRNLTQLVEKGKFREDLFYRLNVFNIENMPLRERKEDIPLLVDHFIKSFNKQLNRNVEKISSKNLDTLLNYDYPGNIRELENIIQRSMILSRGKLLNLDFIRQADHHNPTTWALDRLIKNHLQKALRKTQGKITGRKSAAELLEIKGKTLASKLRKYNIDPKKYRN